MKRPCSALALGAVLWAAPLLAAMDPAVCPLQEESSGQGPPPAGLLPSDARLENQGAVIGTIEVHAQNVFDPSLPGEDHRLFRLANRLHRRTRDAVIARQLLVRPGEYYSRRLLEESERILRGNRYLYDARICPVAYTGNTVDLAVTTRDVWTLKAEAGLGRSGGVNNGHVKLQDDNLLGSGKSLTLENRTTVDRSEDLVRYFDRNLLSRRTETGFTLARNSDGDRENGFLRRPFYALDTRWAAQFSCGNNNRIDSLYELGRITDQFRQRQLTAEFSGGLSRGLLRGWARRFSLGFAFERNRFEAVSAAAAQAPLPAERTLAYPFAEIDLLEDAFAKGHDLDQIHRTEDLFLGRRWQARLGWSAPLFGADRREAVVASTFTGGWKPQPGHTLLLSATAGGRRGADGAHNALLQATTRYYRRDFGEQIFYVMVTGAVARRLDPENQLLLGGDNGLRGYPLRYQSGDRLLLLTLEQRIFTSLYPFRLVRLGGALFFDIGRAWWSDGSHRTTQLGTLRDIGVGLRLASSRSSFGSVLHLDVAFPLDGERSIRRVQFLVKTEDSF